MIFMTNPHFGNTFHSEIQLQHEIEKSIGCRKGDLEVCNDVLPIYAFYHGVFLNGVANNKNRITSAKVPRWNQISWKEYGTMINEFIINSAFPSTKLEEMGISLESGFWFWKYIRGDTLPRKMVEAGRENCNWPLGCPQNLSDGTSPYARELGNDGEHVRPEKHGGTVMQDMCNYHNRMKTSFPYWDILTWAGIFFNPPDINGLIHEFDAIFIDEDQETKEQEGFLP